MMETGKLRRVAALLRDGAACRGTAADTLDAAACEIDRRREASRRIYAADGTFHLAESEEAAIEFRKAAARRIATLTEYTGSMGFFFDQVAESLGFLKPTTPAESAGLCFEILGAISTLKKAAAMGKGTA